MPNINTWIDVPDIEGYTFSHYGIAKSGQWILLDDLINKKPQMIVVKDQDFSYRRLVYTKNPELEISDLTWYEMKDFPLACNSAKTLNVVFTGVGKKTRTLWQVNKTLDKSTIEYLTSRYTYFAIIGKEE